MYWWVARHDLLPDSMQTPLIVCEHCRGVGRIGTSRCSFCHGKTLGVYAHGRFLFWDHPLNVLEISYAHLRERADRFVSVIGLLLGFVGCAAVVALAVRTIEETPFWTAAFWNIPHAAFVWGAMGLLIIWFIVARMVRYREVKTDVAAHLFAQSEAPEQQLSWAQVRQLPTAQVQNISATFSREALRAVERAYVLAAERRAAQVTPAFIIAALFEQNTMEQLLVRMLQPPKTTREKYQKFLESTTQPIIPVMSEAAWAVLFGAYDEAWQHHAPEVDVTDLFTAALAHHPATADFFFELGISKEMVANVVAWARVNESLRRARRRRVSGGHGRGTGDTNRAMTAVATPYLNTLSTDLTKLSLFGHLEPMVGRTLEVEQVFRALQSGSSGVMLVGHPGVGKQTIIHGIADLMVSEAVPELLHDKRLVELDVPRLLSGANPAEAEERLLASLDEASRAGNIVLVIPNIEKMMGVSLGGQQSMDVASVLTAQLQHRAFVAIATTTPDAFNKLIANQPIGGSFQKVVVDEMDINSAIQVLEAKAGTIEYNHDVWLTYGAVERAVTLAQRYLPDDFLPRKAIQLMSEAALSVRNTRGKEKLVMADDVARLVAEKTKIPVTAVTEVESDKLMRLESAMHERVVGQSEAVTAVANALRRARAEVRSGKRPIANFLFVGPTGVGKTELTKTIAEVYFGSEQQMIRLDMSEYQDSSSLYRMIGRPGEQGTGVLTEAVRQKPFSLLLLDELEKADPNVLNIFLQVMDDGRLTDSVGRVIDFTNVILIATSNAGTSFVQEQVSAGTPLEKIKTDLIHRELKQYFRPEFINRFDTVVMFQPLTQEQMVEVARRMVRGIAKKLEERGIGLEVSESALHALAAAGYDPEFGVRPLRRVMQDQIENTVAGMLLQNQVQRRDTIVFDEQGAHVRPGSGA